MTFTTYLVWSSEEFMECQSSWPPLFSSLAIQRWYQAWRHRLVGVGGAECGFQLVISTFDNTFSVKRGEWGVWVSLFKLPLVSRVLIAFFIKFSQTRSDGLLDRVWEPCHPRNLLARPGGCKCIVHKPTEEQRKTNPLRATPARMSMWMWLTGRVFGGLTYNGCLWPTLCRRL